LPFGLIAGSPNNFCKGERLNHRRLAPRSNAAAALAMLALASLRSGSRRVARRSSAALACARIEADASSPPGLSSGEGRDGKIESRIERQEGLGFKEVPRFMLIERIGNRVHPIMQDSSHMVKSRVRSASASRRRVFAM